jgi:hypothetical protein
MFLACERPEFKPTIVKKKNRQAGIPTFSLAGKIH